MGLLSKLEAERRGSIENPNVPISEAADMLLGAWGGPPVRSGVRVNEATAVRVPAVFAAVRVISETLAALPIHLYRKRDDGGRDMETGHRAAQLISGPPNPEMTSYTLKQATQGHVCLWGNGYWEIERDRAGRLKGFWPIQPDKVHFTRIDRKPVYVVRMPQKTGLKDVALRPEQVLHVKAFGGTGTMGTSPIWQCAEALGLALATEAHGAAFFGNGSTPGGVLTTEVPLKDEAYQRLKKSWEQGHRGLDQAHRVAILEQGVKWEQTGMPARDAQMIETREFQISEIARIFRVPPHKIADLSKATFSNIEHQGIEFVVDTMLPWVVNWEKELDRRLLSDVERRRGLFFKFSLNGLLRGDTAARHQTYAIGRQWGYYSANDVRAFEELNPIPDGDIYLSPGNMMPADMAGEQLLGGGGSDNGGDPDAARMRKLLEHDAGPELRLIEHRRTRSLKARRGLAGSYARMIADVAQRIINREVNAARRALDRLAAWLDGPFFDEHEEWVRARMLPVLRAYFEAVQREVADEIDGDIGLTPQMERDLDSYTKAFAKRHVNLSRNQLRKLINEIPDPDELRDALETRLDEWKESRAEKLADTEAIRGGGGFAKLAYVAMGVRALRWVARGDDTCPYCRRLDGEVVGVEQAFANPGDEIPGHEGEVMRVNAKVGHPPLHKGCDCQIVSGD